MGINYESKEWINYRHSITQDPELYLGSGEQLSGSNVNIVIIIYM